MSLKDIQAQWRKLALTSDITKYDVDRHHDFTGPDRGFSVNPVTGRSATSGYMVGLHHDMGGIEHTHNMSKLAPSDIAEHRIQGASHWKNPHMYQGGWGTKDGRAVLDVSHNIDDLDEAMENGRKNKQEAIWDVKGQKEIPIT